MIAIGVLCLREFLEMPAAMRPIGLPAYLAVAAMVVAAHFGTAFNVLLVFAASSRSLRLRRRPPPRDGITISIAVTLLGIVWIGIPLAHAVLLRDLPSHGAALLIDVLVGTFAHRHRRLRHRPHVRLPQNRPQPLAEQDHRGR